MENRSDSMTMTKLNNISKHRVRIKSTKNLGIFLLLLACSTSCDAFLLMGTENSQIGTMRTTRTDIVVSATKEEEDDFVDLNEISDGEALLACRAYLQRKNRLGWKEGAERKEMRKDLQELSFFWETPEEEEDWARRKEEEIDFDQNDEADFSTNGEREPSIEDPKGLFTAMPIGPSRASEIRRRAKNEQWADPAFRERWYEARWGDHVKRTDASRKQQRMQSKLQAIPESILESPEFAKMTEDEIDEAIVTYVLSNRRRSRTRTKQTADKRAAAVASRQQQPDPDEPVVRLDRDSLFSVSDDRLREQQQKRAERAKKAYATRIANAKKKKKPKTSTVLARKPVGATPKDALERIGVDLDADRMPSLEDVKSVMEAARLSRRKDVLQRIVTDQFGLRGKCVPVVIGNESPSEAKKIFLTKASMTQLGAFVIGLMKEK